MQRRLRRPGSGARVGRAVTASLGAAALLGIGYAATTWLRYGAKDRVARRGPRDRLLDAFMPDYDVAERHATLVAAPADDTFAAARAMDLDRSAVVRAIFRARELLMGGGHAAPLAGNSLLEKVQRIGWGVLAEEPGRALVLGAATRPWEANVRFRALPPDEFRAFAEPGYVKIVWTLAAESRGPARSVFRTETRVATTDAEARRRFRRYWTMVSPGIHLIRRVSLRLVKAEAERRQLERELPRRGRRSRPADGLPSSRSPASGAAP